MCIRDIEWFFDFLFGNKVKIDVDGIYENRSI